MVSRGVGKRATAAMGPPVWLSAHPDRRLPAGSRTDTRRWLARVRRPAAERRPGRPTGPGCVVHPWPGARLGVLTPLLPLARSLARPPSMHGHERAALPWRRPAQPRAAQPVPHSARSALTPRRLPPTRAGWDSTQRCVCPRAQGPGPQGPTK